MCWNKELSINDFAVGAGWVREGKAEERVDVGVGGWQFLKSAAGKGRCFLMLQALCCCMSLTA